MFYGEETVQAPPERNEEDIYTFMRMGEISVNNELMYRTANA